MYIQSIGQSAIEDLKIALEHKATWLHVEPQANGTRVRARIDGEGVILRTLPDVQPEVYLVHLQWADGLRSACNTPVQIKSVRVMLADGAFKLVVELIP